MSTTIQLKVNGRSYEYPNPTKITEITQEEYDELLPLMKIIIDLKKKNIWNFNKVTRLVWSDTTNEWVRDYVIKKSYPEEFHKEIDKLMKYVPDNIDGINSFELLKIETLDKLV